MEESSRQQYHFGPPGGWMNEPHGLIHHAEIWHLFDQVVPSGAEGKHGGHAFST